MSLRLPSRRLVVTGSRFWGNPRRVFEALNGALGYGEFLLGVGDCPTGADLFARQWGRDNLAWPFTQFHAPWAKRRKAAGMIRNHFMIDMFRPQLVLAFFRPESRGTVDCAEYAESLGIKVIPFYEGFDEENRGAILFQADRAGSDVARIRTDDEEAPQEDELGPAGSRNEARA